MISFEISEEQLKQLKEIDERIESIQKKVDERCKKMNDLIEDQLKIIRSQKNEIDKVEDEYERWKMGMWICSASPVFYRIGR